MIWFFDVVFFTRACLKSKKSMYVSTTDRLRQIILDIKKSLAKATS